MKRALLIIILVFQSCINFKKDFSFIAIPDTQKFMNNEMYDVFESQINWIVEQKDKLNIAALFHEGDIVDFDERDDMWAMASKGMEKIDSLGIPYLMACGNHDYSMGSGNGNPHYLVRESTKLGKYFPKDRIFKNGRIGDHYKEGMVNTYMLQNVEGNDFLFLALEIYPRREVLDWAYSLIKSYPKHTVIIVTHTFLEVDGNPMNSIEFIKENGSVIDGIVPKIILEELKQFPNLIITLSGHRIKENGEGFSKRVDFGKNGNKIVSIMANYQNIPKGVETVGSLRILQFDPYMKNLQVRTYSPVNKKFINDPENEFTINLH